MTFNDTTTTCTPANPSISELWNLDLIRKYDLSGPRYTSYPTAAQFTPQVSVQQWLTSIEASNTPDTPLSLYFHLPFCETVCYYCACNKIITANKSRATEYLNYLYQEIAMQGSHINKDRKVTQLHWGGGTPTYISDAEMTELMSQTREHFNLLNDDSGEYSIEVHPAGLTPARITHLRRLGFNRLSMGIQDFDPQVQHAVNRFNTETEVNTLVKTVREEKFKSISMDLIYGLPHQTRHTFAQTLRKVIDLNPDRLSVFNYAHMPHLFKVQKQINASQLPEPQEKMAILHDSIETLLASGYEYIGMDHFAKPEDELAQAQKNGSLQRNFQGYSTQRDCDLLAFGVSSINSAGGSLIQNHKDMDSYQTAIKAKQLPIAKIVSLNKDDKLRKAVIDEIMCHFQVNLELIERDFSISFTEYFAEETQRLQEMEEDQLITVTPKHFIVNPVGRLLVRRICMEFDAYIDHAKAQNSKSYSRII